MSNSLYHELAQWLTELMKPSDTLAFLNRLFNEGYKVPDNDMRSFDVTSLYINVPLPETVKYICNFMDTCNFAIPFPIVI